VSTPDLELRFRAALCIRADEELRSGCVAWLYDHHLQAAGEELQLSEGQLDRFVTKLVERGFLGDEGGFYEAMPLAVLWEEEFDREEFRRRNVLRRELLQLAARASDAREELEYSEGEEQFIDRSWLELLIALRYLHFYEWVELHEFLGHSFSLDITPDGYDLTQDEAELARRLPTTATEDEQAHTPVAPEAMRQVIGSVDALLSSRGWSGAQTELARGDQQYAAGHWVDAVSEYYAALESGLKHRLDEASVSYSGGASLRDLARLAVDHLVIPTNYQALFTFLDSIRSPRRHGRGAGPDPVEVGPAEALLMGNHARSLLLYLGHRPTE
jgi:hypothetical protein